MNFEGGVGIFRNWEGRDIFDQNFIWICVKFVIGSRVRSLSKSDVEISQHQTHKLNYSYRKRKRVWDMIWNIYKITVVGPKIWFFCVSEFSLGTAGERLFTAKSGSFGFCNLLELIKIFRELSKWTQTWWFWMNQMDKHSTSFQMRDFQLKKGF